MPSRVPALLLCACADPPARTEANSPVACNGDPSLCDRRLDDVTFPGTHNSMSNADAGWFAPNQQHGLSRQLEDGIRALMLDVWEWEGELWLCHALCEAGAQPFDEGLEEIASFVTGHPGQIVLVIFEDHVTVAEAVGALEEAGMADLAWPWDGGEMPTLGDLRGTPLVLAAESGGPPPDWYHHAWDLYFDTPYDYESAEEFSCALNRGDAENPLFLVNHWVGTPLPSAEAAAEVNAEAVLGARARACEAEQGRRITFLGVDFYDQGDLFAVVDALNAPPG